MLDEQNADYVGCLAKCVAHGGLKVCRESRGLSFGTLVWKTSQPPRTLSPSKTPFFKIILVCPDLILDLWQVNKMAAAIRTFDTKASVCTEEKVLHLGTYTTIVDWFWLVKYDLDSWRCFCANFHH
jgi:hypothetical protein